MMQIKIKLRLFNIDKCIFKDLLILFLDVRSLVNVVRLLLGDWGFMRNCGSLLRMWSRVLVRFVYSRNRPCH